MIALPHRDTCTPTLAMSQEYRNASWDIPMLVVKYIHEVLFLLLAQLFTNKLCVVEGCIISQCKHTHLGLTAAAMTTNTKEKQSS